MVSRMFKVDEAGHQLRGDVAAAYLRALAAGMPAGGVDVFARTLAQQRYLYDHQPPRAAYPSPTAPHVDGRALDFHTTTNGRYAPSPAFVWAMKGASGASNPRPGEQFQLGPFGFRRTVPSERWHLEYDRVSDRHRAGDLVAKLKALGFKTVAAFQKSAGLVDDGIDGPLTWSALLEATQAIPEPVPVPTPVPDPVPVPAALDINVGEYNAQLKRWGGGKYINDAAFVLDVLDPDILLGSEMEEDCRIAIVDATGMKVWAYKTLGVFWNPALFGHGPRIELDLLTNYHGMIGTELDPLVDGVPSFVAATVHIRPNDAFPASWSDARRKAGKASDIRAVIAKLERYPRVVVGGDWNTAAVHDLMVAAGYQAAAPFVDTHDAAGVQRLDGVYVKGMTVRGKGSVHETSASDHHGLSSQLRISAAT